MLGIALLLSSAITVLFGLDNFLGISIPLKLSFAAPYVSNVFWSAFNFDCILVISLLVTHAVDHRALGLAASACAIVTFMMVMTARGGMHSEYRSAIAGIMIVSFVLMLIFGIAAFVNWLRSSPEPSHTGE